MNPGDLERAKVILLEKKLLKIATIFHRNLKTEIFFSKLL